MPVLWLSGIEKGETRSGSEKSKGRVEWESKRNLCLRMKKRL